MHAHVLLSRCILYLISHKELDEPNEFFADEASHTLFYLPNETSVAASDFVVPTLPSLIHVEGTQAAPVVGLTLYNMTFAHTAETYMSGYTVVSGGDYAIHRDAAVKLEGTIAAQVEGNLFDRVGGNGLLLSGYNRNATVGHNSFRKLGDSAILLVGNADLLDATGGDYPRFTTIESNTAYEYGLLGKQNAAVFQAVSCQTLIQNNIFFSGPRHGINFNDGMVRLIVPLLLGRPRMKRAVLLAGFYKWMHAGWWKQTSWQSSFQPSPGV